MDQRIINLFDRFTHGGMSRREFLDKLALMAGSAAAIATIMTIMETPANFFAISTVCFMSTSPINYQLLITNYQLQNTG